MKNTVEKLNSFIVKIVLLLEEELEKIETSESQNTLKTKSSIIETLNKLITMLARLNKISKEDVEEEMPLSEADEAIIEHYFEKYTSWKKTCQVGKYNEQTIQTLTSELWSPGSRINNKPPESTEGE